MFAAQLLGPNVVPGGIYVPDLQVYAIAAVMLGALVCAFMALPTKAKRIVAALVLAVGLTLGMASLSAAEVPGLECEWFWWVMPWLCWL